MKDLGWTAKLHTEKTHLRREAASLVDALRGRTLDPRGMEARRTLRYFLAGAISLTTDELQRYIDTLRAAR